MNKIESLRRACAWLQSKGLDTFKKVPDVSIYEGNVRLSIYRSEITDEEFFLIKKFFGPLKVEKGYDSKGMKGEVRMDAETKITFTVNNVYACENIDPETLTERDWEDIRAKVNDGLITIQDCKPIEA